MKNLSKLAAAAVLAAAPLSHALAAPVAAPSQPLAPALALIIGVALLCLAGRRHGPASPWQAIRIS